MKESQEKQIRASCRTLATYKLQTSFSALVQPDNHVVQKFDTRKIYQLWNEVIFFAPFFVCFSLFAFNLARRQSRDFKIGDYGRLGRLDRCHVTKNTRDLLPSSFWDGMFSPGFSS